MTEIQRDAIPNPAEGLLVYNTDEKCVNFYNGTDWKSFCGDSTNPGGDFQCGTFMANGEWKEWMCHNLGADMSLDPFELSKGIHGDYYMWGKSEPLATVDTDPGTIPGFYDIPVAEGDAWLNDQKTENDPCPNGFRVPTRAQWDEVIANNDLTLIGPWDEEGVTNWDSGVKFGDDFLLPAAGVRASGLSGLLIGRGTSAYYWSSTNAVPPPYGPGGDGLSGYMNVATTFGWDPMTNNSSLRNGYSVRCISE
ncbi:MAG: hypothetical protein WBF83_08655 [Moheibacter sp.]